MESIKPFFNPASVAVVGVSDDPTKLGSVVFNNMVEAGFKGRLFPVNPKYPELFGHTAYPNIKDIPGDVELAVIVVPAPFVIGVMNDCAAKNVKATIIITAGFKESGEEGKKIEDEVLRIAQENGIRVMGPNCLGIIAPGFGLNASFAASTPRHGNIGLLSQSGAFCTAVLDMAIPSNMGFSHFVSFGNKCDVDENDMVEYLLNDSEVKVIGAYLEEIKYGQDLAERVLKNKVRKPIILLKPGQTNEAKKAIASHTGSMAGSIQTFKTAVQQSGIIEAKGIRDMFNLLMGFSCAPLPKGNRVAIITNAGGPGIIATDALINAGFKMAEISHESHAKLKESLPPTASLHNPIDVVGDALADRYNAAVHTLAVDPNVDAIVILLTPQLVTQIEDTAKVIINASKLYKKPIIPVMIGRKYTSPVMSRFYDNRMAAFTDISDAVEVLKEMYEFEKNAELYNAAAVESKYELLKIAGKGKYREEVKNSGASAVKALDDELVVKLAAEVGIELPKQKVCKNVEEAVELAKDVYPVVVKATNSAIAHKTDFKALYLNIKSEEELRQCYAELEGTIRAKANVQEPEILVQEMIKFEEQIFIGANRDGDANVYENDAPGFGHLVAFGQGGIYTEIYHDLGYVIVPALGSEIVRALDTTKIAKIMDGARGKDPLAKTEVIKAIEAIQKLVVLYPEIISLDINPLLVTASRAVAVDIKIFVE